ncbi:MAG: HlyD family efflux transporter periplasmic adaptor subunit, partial [candidate division Zixibacteria bacterium]|nr:HlyD family efflux transporter periplasmic adaptor subunit [candidate division Zixibacteria bacterium]
EELETARSTTSIARAEAENKAARLELLMSPPKPEEEAVILSEIDKQQAKLRFLYSQKDAQSITTPIAGKVVIDYQQNEFLSVVNNGVVEVLVPVSDFDFKLVAPGQRVKLKVRSFTNRLFKGTVVHIPRGAVPNSTNANFYASAILDNEDDILTDGSTGYAKIDIGRASLFTQVMRKIASIIRVEFWSWW